MVRHGEGVAVSAEPEPAGAIGLQHRMPGFRRFPLEPLDQRRTHVEADLFQGVHDALDASVGGGNAGGNDRAIAFPLNPAIPVVKRGGAGLRFHQLEPRPARRLVEMRG